MEWGSAYRVRCALEDIEKVVRWSNEGSECKRGYLLPAVEQLALHAPDKAFETLMVELGRLRHDNREIRESRSLAILSLVRGLTAAGNTREKPLQLQWLDADAVRVCRLIPGAPAKRQAVVLYTGRFLRDWFADRATTENAFADLPLETMRRFISAVEYNDPDRIFFDLTRRLLETKEPCFHLTDLVGLYTAVEKRFRSRSAPFQKQFYDYLEAYCPTDEEQESFDSADIFRLATERLPPDDRRDAFLAKTMEALERGGERWARSMASCLMKLYQPK